MNELPSGVLLTTLALLILASAFFSSSETGMIALNRYRLRHMAKEGHRTARLVENLLKRTDRLIGVILIGNNFVNNYAATIAALLAWQWYGSTGTAIAPIIFTVIMLIFAEVTPKTFAAYKPETIAFPASYILRPLLTLLAPLVWLVNGLSNGLLRIAGVNPQQQDTDHLSPAELRTIVNEAGGLIPEKHQRMLLSILDLENATVEDIMIPRNEMVGIDIDADIQEILSTLRASQHTRLPVFKGDTTHVIGILHLRKLTRLLEEESLNKASIMQLTLDPYFVPEGTPLHQQLINFQHEKRRIAFVVDEYGDVQGIVTLEDILEEIVGEFTTDLAATSQDIHPQEDGSYLMDATVHLREVNRALGWELDTDGPKTLNGLLLEHLQSIPESGTSIRIGNYLFEVMQVNDNMIRTLKVKHASSEGLLGKTKKRRRH